jgi:hypothetical protein
MTRKAMARAMACINNLIIALFSKQGFSNHAHARRIFDANPFAALALILRCINRSISHTLTGRYRTV